MAAHFIELKQISKRFAGVQALDDVSLTLAPGEIHCLAGENGSGKSTVIKVMSGVYQPDGGEIYIDGRKVTGLTPKEAIRHGIQVIYQDFSLFGNLSVAENIALGTLVGAGRRRADHRQMRDLARGVLARLDIDLDLEREVGTLPTSGKQIVAIARALLCDARLIVMDEPTTALTGREVETLFRITRDLQAQGIAVLFVSHKMREMLDLSERLTIFRNGRKVSDGPISAYDEAAITRHMTGLDLAVDHYHYSDPDPVAPPRLMVEKLTVPGQVDGVSFELRAGEIVGLSGLLGSGRTEIACALFGMLAHDGRVQIDGHSVSLDSVRAAIAAGIAYVPEDRLSEGLFLTQSIERNMLATSYEGLAPGGIIDRARGRQLTDDMIKAMQIATPTADKPVGQLSGGNAQRVVLGRWLLTGARVLILNGPTVGVDVGSKAEIHAKIRDLAIREGLAVLMISDDVPELVQNCNRILMVHRGRIVEEFDNSPATEDTINTRLKTLK